MGFSNIGGGNMNITIQVGGAQANTQGGSEGTQGFQPRFDSAKDRLESNNGDSEALKDLRNLKKEVDAEVQKEASKEAGGDMTQQETMEKLLGMIMQLLQQVIGGKEGGEGEDEGDGEGKGKGEGGGCKKGGKQDSKGPSHMAISFAAA